MKVAFAALFLLILLSGCHRSGHYEGFNVASIFDPGAWPYFMDPEYAGRIRPAPQSPTGEPPSTASDRVLERLKRREREAARRQLERTREATWLWRQWPELREEGQRDPDPQVLLNLYKSRFNHHLGGF